MFKAYCFVIFRKIRFSIVKIAHIYVYESETYIFAHVNDTCFWIMFRFDFLFHRVLSVVESTVLFHSYFCFKQKGTWIRGIEKSVKETSRERLNGILYSLDRFEAFIRYIACVGCASGSLLMKKVRTNDTCYHVCDVCACQGNMEQFLTWTRSWAYRVDTRLTSLDSDPEIIWIIKNIILIQNFKSN